MSTQSERLAVALDGRYTILKELGAGGMGTVYLGEDLRHGRKVAIKVMNEESTSSMWGDRFLREIEIAAGLVNPHIVPVHDSGSAEGQLYFVMPFIDGESLKQVLARDGALEVRRAIAIAVDVADGLQHAHEQGFVHRDIKPGNVLLTGRHALVADFGVARPVTSAPNLHLTEAGTTVGTSFYTSPEQLSDTHEADPRSDLYSLGCVLHEMLAGEPPFRGRTMAAVAAGHIQGEIPLLDAVREDVSAPVAAVVARMLAKDPDARFQTAREVGEALTAAGPESRTAQGHTRLGRVWRAAPWVALAAVTASVFVFQPRSGPPLSVDGEVRSVVVLPYHDAASTDEEKLITVELAGELTRQLNRWETVRAVPQVAVAGLSFDLGLSAPTLDRIDEGVRIARNAGVERLVTLTAKIRSGDTTVVTTAQFDVRTSRSVGETLEAVGLRSDRFRLAAQIAHGMLGLEGNVEDVEELRLQSAYPAALIQEAEGRRLLGSWRLQGAEAAFRAALSADSTFSMAHHYLALTLYWQTAQEVNRLQELAPELARESLAALRFAQGLSVRDSTRVTAFYRFQDGDYDDARRGYEALLARDPTDVYAWLLLGIVEYRDPWLVERGDGTYAPRSNLNTALRAFSETVRLSPGFHLGYGHLFDITGKLLATAETGTGYVFELPRDEVVRPWDTGTPLNGMTFYPVERDSIVWVTAASGSLLSEDPEVARGAERLLGNTRRTLRRWTEYAPDEARPLDELVTWTLRDRDKLGIPADPREIDSLTAIALEHAERALQLRPDSLQIDLLRLGNLRLASGDADAAQRLVASAAARRQEGSEVSQNRMASNIYLYRGRPGAAIELLANESDRRRYYRVPGNADPVPDAGAEPTIERLRVLGSTQAIGSFLHEQFDELGRLWSPARYSPEALAVLRTQVAPRFASALVFDDDATREWTQAAELVDPIWDLLRADPADTLASRERLQVARAFVGTEVSPPSRAYILGTKAQRLGMHSDAIQFLSRLDSVPFSVTARDPGWGLLSLSYYGRGRSYELLGDQQQAIAWYERFLDAWTEPDALVPPLADSARSALARLRPRD